MMHRSTSFRSALALGCAASLLALPVAAATFRVGAGSTGCTHATLPEAIAAAEASAGRDVIRVTRSVQYLQQAISIATSQELEITGGYLNCESIANDGVTTTINGSGGAQEPVFRITGNSGSLVTLKFLTITGGDEDGEGSGGGIAWIGNGILIVEDATLINNVGGYGGGIAAKGTGTLAELVIGARTNILVNTARYNGGGLHLESLETTISSPDTRISFNEATGVGGSGGYGGGVQIRACDFHSIAYVGSPGLQGLGVISSNLARFGGGVAIEGGDGCGGDAQMRMYSTDADQLTKISGNEASVSGGAIYTYPNLGARADVSIWNASVEGNQAPSAAAVRLGSGAQLIFNSEVTAPPSDAAACAQGRSCGRIANNVSANGRVIDGEAGNLILLKRALISGNRGSELVRLHEAQIEESLIVANEASARLIHVESLRLFDSTITDNQVGGSHVLSSGENGNIVRSIIWQPGDAAYTFSGMSNTGDILTNDIGSFGGSSGTRLSSSSPRFVDPARADYTLRAASPAVDFAPPSAFAFDAFDLLGLPRDRDMPIVPDRFGVRDIGAFERQVIDNIVLNRDFEVDLNLWTAPVPAAVIWQQEGASSVGAVRVDFGGVPPPIEGIDAASEGIDAASPSSPQSPTGNPRLAALIQCIHLPGPGNYRLSGFARSAGALAFERDVLSIRWEFRAQGNEECNGNAPNRIGEHFITSGTAWTSSATPTLISVSPAEWTRSSSIRLQLIVEDRGTVAPPRFNGFFDGIKLFAEVAAPTDLLFSNGFE